MICAAWIIILALSIPDSLLQWSNADLAASTAKLTSDAPHDSSWHRTLPVWSEVRDDTSQAGEF